MDHNLYSKLGRNALGRGEGEPYQAPGRVLTSCQSRRRRRAARGWLPLAVLLVLDLGVASGLLLRGARAAGLPAGLP